MKALLSACRIMTLAEFLADVPPERIKVASRKTDKTDWAALSPAKQAFDEPIIDQAKEAA